MKFCYTEQSIKSNIMLGALTTVAGFMFILFFLVTMFQLIPTLLIGVAMLAYSIPVLSSGYGRKMTSYNADSNGLNIINANGMKTLVKWRDIKRVEDKPSYIYIHSTRGKEIIYKDLDKIDEFYTCLVRYLAPGEAKKAEMKETKEESKAEKKAEKKATAVLEESQDEEAMRRKTESRKLLEQIMINQAPQKLKEANIQPKEEVSAAPEKEQPVKVKDKDSKKEPQTVEINDKDSKKEYQKIVFPIKADYTASKKSRMVHVPDLGFNEEPIEESKTVDNKNKKSKLVSAFLQGAMGSPKLSKQTLVITESVASAYSEDYEEKKNKLLEKHSQLLKAKQEKKSDFTEQKLASSDKMQLSDYVKTFKAENKKESINIFEVFGNTEFNTNPFMFTLDPESSFQDNFAANENFEPIVSEQKEEVKSETKRLRDELSKISKFENFDQNDSSRTRLLLSDVLQNQEKPESSPGLNDLLDKVQTKKLPKFDSGVLRKALYDFENVKADTASDDKASDSSDSDSLKNMNLSLKKSLTETRIDEPISQEAHILNETKEQAPKLDDLLTQFGTTGRLSLGQKIERPSRTQTKINLIIDKAPESEKKEIQPIFQMSGEHSPKQNEINLNIDKSQTNKKEIPDLSQLLNNFEKTTRLSLGKTKPSIGTDKDVIDIQSKLFDRK